jgi:hypothetical protein
MTGAIIEVFQSKKLPADRADQPDGKIYPSDPRVPRANIVLEVRCQLPFRKWIKRSS